MDSRSSHSMVSREIPLENIELPKYSNTIPASDPSAGEANDLPGYSRRDPAIYWTPQRTVRYDTPLHVASLVLALPVIALYVVDIYEAQTYANAQPGSSSSLLPTPLIAVDVLAIADGILIIFWATAYLRAVRGWVQTGWARRSFTTTIDVVLWAIMLGVSNTTLGTRSSVSACPTFRTVGGCEAWRRHLSIVTGVIGILLA